MRWIALVAALLFPAAAQAHYSRTSRIHNFRHVSEAMWGQVCDVGAMHVPIITASYVDRDGPQGPGRYPLGPNSGYAITGPMFNGYGTACRTYIGAGPWPSQSLCSILVHEDGHHTFHDHVYGDVGNIMSPMVPPWPPCDPMSVRRIAASYPR